MTGLLKSESNTAEGYLTDIFNGYSSVVLDLIRLGGMKTRVLRNMEISLVWNASMGEWIADFSIFKSNLHRAVIIHDDNVKLVKIPDIDDSPRAEPTWKSAMGINTDLISGILDVNRKFFDNKLDKFIVGFNSKGQEFTKVAFQGEQLRKVSNLHLLHAFAVMSRTVPMDSWQKDTLQDLVDVTRKFRSWESALETLTNEIFAFSPGVIPMDAIGATIQVVPTHSEVNFDFGGYVAAGNQVSTEVFDSLHPSTGISILPNERTELLVSTVTPSLYYEFVQASENVEYYGHLMTGKKEFVYEFCTNEDGLQGQKFLLPNGIVEVPEIKHGSDYHRWVPADEVLLAKALNADDFDEYTKKVSARSSNISELKVSYR